MLKIKKVTVIKACEKRIQLFEQEAIEQGKTAGKIFLGVFVLSMLFFVLKGIKTGKKKYVSGVQVTKPWKLKWRLRLTGKDSDLKIGGVPLTINSENRHMFFAGVPGVGKTNAFNEMLSQVRKRGNRAVVVDTTGGFVEKFYREGKDISSPLTINALSIGILGLSALKIEHDKKLIMRLFFGASKLSILCFVRSRF